MCFWSWRLKPRLNFGFPKIKNGISEVHVGIFHLCSAITPIFGRFSCQVWGTCQVTESSGMLTKFHLMTRIGSLITKANPSRILKCTNRVRRKRKKNCDAGIIYLAYISSLDPLKMFEKKNNQLKGVNLALIINIINPFLLLLPQATNFSFSLICIIVLNYKFRNLTLRRVFHNLKVFLGAWWCIDFFPFQWVLQSNCINQV